MSTDTPFHKFDDDGWPPKCWKWAWENMPHIIDRGGEQANMEEARITTNDVVDWHWRHKTKVVEDPITHKRTVVQVCPHCLPLPVSKKPNSGFAI